MDQRNWNAFIGPPYTLPGFRYRDIRASEDFTPNYIIWQFTWHLLYFQILFMAHLHAAYANPEMSHTIPEPDRTISALPSLPVLLSVVTYYGYGYVHKKRGKILFTQNVLSHHRRGLCRARSRRLNTYDQTCLCTLFKFICLCHETCQITNTNAANSVAGTCDKYITCFISVFTTGSQGCHHSRVWRVWLKPRGSL